MKELFFLILVFFTGCTAEKRVLNAKMPSLENKPADSIRIMQLSGFDYIASGNQVKPWKFQMNFDDSMQFQINGGGKFVVRTPQPRMAESKYFFSTTTSLGETKIIISMQACNPENIRIEIAGQTFTGCGQFLYNPMLHGNWQMVAIGSENLLADNFKLGLPVFQLDLNQMTIAAHNGDNYFAGGISVIGKRIEIKELKQFPGNSKNKINREVIPLMLGNLSKYELTGNRLNITLKNDMVVYFNRIFAL